jgi:DNA replication ATP-dependent helicase Dna2
VSESTKNKLQAFQFAPPQSKLDKIPEPAKAGKENETAAPLPKATPRAPNAVGNAVTPVARLAWQDLLGVPEADKMEEDDTSPSERIMWRPDPKAAPNTSGSPVLSRKVRKRRARSSSPVSSPATSRTPGANPKLRAPGLQTPHADPALELWDRGTTGVMNPLLARMMVSSSPRPPKADSSPGTERSLRKSVSCGSNWPKRRRIERLDVEHTAVSQDNERPTTKSSLVSALLQTVDGEIRKSNTPVEEEEEQTSSPSRRRSPRKSRTDPQPIVRPSPIQEAPEPNISEPMRSSSATIHEPADNGIQQTTTQAPSDYGVDDFGDDDFDEDTLMELDAIVNQPGHADTSLVAAEEPPPAVAAPCASKAVVDDEFDEFGDLDDDLFDGAEDLVVEVESKFASQAAIQGKQQNALPQTNMGEEEDDPYGLGDDFGDDLDFEAIELAATQSASRASALTHVRSVR